VYGIAAAHPFAVLAFAVVRQVFRTSDPHGAGRVARHDRKLISFFGNRGRYRKQYQQGECDLDYRHATARSSRLLSPIAGLVQKQASQSKYTCGPLGPRSAFGSGVRTLRQNFVTVLLPFLAYFGAIGDESGGECAKVSVAQVEGKTRTSSVLLAF
jgi:hypothetical protein